MYVQMDQRVQHGWYFIITSLHLIRKVLVYHFEPIVTKFASVPQ